MSYGSAKSIFVFWSLEQLFFLEVYALNNKMINFEEDWYLLEKGRISSTKPERLKVYDRNGLPYIVVKGMIDILNSTILSHLTAFRLTGFSSRVLDVFGVPDGVFTFPAAMITLSGKVNARSSKLDSKLALADISDFQKAKQYDIIPDDSFVIKDFVSLSWTSKKDLLVCRSYDVEFVPREDLMLYRRKKGNETQIWEAKMVTLIYATRMLLFENIWESFEALYVNDYARKSLVLLWPETELETPGEWENSNHLKSVVLEKDHSYRDLLLVDVNNDKNLDLLFSNVDNEMWVIEIPISKDFRDPSKYKLHRIITEPEAACPYDLEVFSPFSGSHDGKPWILTGGDCGAFYYVPTSNKPTNWNYKNYEIIREGHVSGVEALDIDKDGFVELFVSLYDRNTIAVYWFTKLNSVFRADIREAVEHSKCSRFANVSHATLIYILLLDYMSIKILLIVVLK